jgi:NADH-quinone oxidoreductase subunit I
MTLSKMKDVLTGLKSLATGLGITGRAFGAKKVTVIYPKQEVANLSTFRGHIELIGKEDAPGEPKCIACGICGKACPSSCITILCPIPAKDGEMSSDPPQMGPAPQKGSKAPGRFEVDFSLCSLCGQCVKACPYDALRFSNNNPYMVSFNRKDFQLDLIARLRSQALD